MIARFARDLGGGTFDLGAARRLANRRERLREAINEAIDPDDRVTGSTRAARPARDFADPLPSQRGGIQPSLPGDNHVGRGEAAIEAHGREDVGRSSDQLRAVRPEAAGEATRRPGPWQLAGIVRQLRGDPGEAPLELDHLLLVGTLLRAIGARSSQEGNVRVTEADDLGVLGIERLESAEPGVGRRAAAAGDQDLPGASRDRRGDQLAGSARARPERIEAIRIEAPEARGLRDLDDRGPPVIAGQREPALDRVPERVVSGDPGPITADRVEQDIGRPLAAVGDRARIRVEPRREAGRDRGRDLGGAQRPLELVRRDESSDPPDSAATAKLGS